MGFAELDPMILCGVAMASTKGPATLRALLSTTDYLNVGYPTLEEINGAFQRLAPSGLVRCDQGRLSAGFDVLQVLGKHHHLPARQLVPLFRAFLETKETFADSRIYFTEDEYRRAASEHTKEMKLLLSGSIPDRGSRRVTFLGSKGTKR